MQRTIRVEFALDGDSFNSEKFMGWAEALAHVLDDARFKIVDLSEVWVECTHDDTERSLVDRNGNTIGAVSIACIDE